MNTLEQAKRDGVFPITFHNYCAWGSPAGRPESVKDWKALGITVGRTPNFHPDKHDKRLVLEMLDACAEENMKCFVCDDRGGYGHHMDKTEDEVRRLFDASLKDFGDHPALFGFDAGDEASKDRIGVGFRTAKIHFEMAPHLTPFMTFGGYTPSGTECMGLRSYRRYLEEYIRVANPTLLFQNNGGLVSPEADGVDSFYRGQKVYVDVTAPYPDMKRWTTLCCTPHLTMDLLGEDTFRWQTSAAAMLGNTGFAWFLVYVTKPHWNYRQAPIDEHWERTAAFEHLSRVLRSFQKMHGATMMKLKYQRSFFLGQRYGGFPYTIDSELVKDVKAEFPVLVSEFVDDEGRDYVGVMNNTREGLGQAVITWHDQPEVFQVGWEGVETVATNYFDDDNPANPAKMTGPWLAPGQMELYRVDSPPSPWLKQLFS